MFVLTLYPDDLILSSNRTCPWLSNRGFYSSDEQKSKLKF